MAQVNAGRVRFVAKGEYNNATQYYTFDLVNYNGNSYYAKENTIGNLPTDTTKWQLVAEKGNVGSTGPTGAPGNGIANIQKTSTSGLVDTYTITYTDGTTTTYQVTNGEDGKVTQAQLDEVQEELDRYKMLENALPKVTGEGTSVTLNDTANAPMKMIPMASELKQETTTGKNLLKTVLPSTTTKDGLTLTQNSDGSFTLNGTSTGAGRFIITNFSDGAYFTLGALGFIQGETGKLSGCPAGGNTSVPTTSYKLFMSGNSGASNVNDGGSGGTITADASNMSGKYYLAIDYASGITFNNMIFKPMIEKGLTITSYEPYTNGASPNPDYPQPIQVVSGDNTIEICGRNLGNPNTLFDEMYNSGYANPPTRTIVDNRNVISFSTYYSHNKPLYVTKYKENTQYTFRVVAKAAESALRYLYIIIDYTDGTKSSASILNQGTSWDELRIASTANKTIKDFYFSYSNAGYWYIDEDSFNIIDGDTTDYETYQGASYPVNLPVENLFDESQLLQADGWTYSNGYYNGLVEKYYVAFRYGFNFNTTFEENTQYTIKLNAYTTGGNPRFKIEYTDGTNYMMNFTETTPTDYSYTTTNGKTISKIVGEYGTGGGQTLYLKDIMVQKGSKANSYTPYGTTPIELCKIGNYKDNFFKAIEGDSIYDSLDSTTKASLTSGMWYLQKNIGKVVLNGTESWQLYSASGNSPRRFGLQDNTTWYADSMQLLSNYFTRGLKDSQNDLEMWTQVHYLAITDKNSNWADANALKTWLSSNNTDVYYSLATPQYIPLNNTLQTQLNNIRDKVLAYQNQTNVSQVNNDLPFTLKLSAIRDMSNIFELIQGTEL